MTLRQRLSASVDAGLIAAAEDAVARGRAPTLSAWVNDALRLKLEQEQRLDALAAFVTAYEAEHGELTPAEVARVQRAVRARAIPVRRRRRSA